MNHGRSSFHRSTHIPMTFKHFPEGVGTKDYPTSGKRMHLTTTPSGSHVQQLIRLMEESELLAHATLFYLVN